MGTTAQNFFPSTTEQDFSAPGESDIRKFVEVVGPSDNTSTIDFDSGSGQDGVIDPYTVRGVIGVVSAANYGWAINRLGNDGMESIADAKRVIQAGTWTFNGRLGASSALTGSYRMRVRAYRVSSAGNRTLLFGPINSASVTPTVAGADVSATSSQPKFTFEADETLMISYSIEKTGASAIGETVQFRLNDAAGNDCEITLPSPVATDYFRTPSDPLGLLDTRTLALSRSLTESLGMLDGAGPLISRTLQESLLASDAHTLALSRALIEDVLLSDAEFQIVAGIRELTDAEGLTDIAKRIRRFRKEAILCILDSRESIAIG